MDCGLIKNADRAIVLTDLLAIPVILKYGMRIWAEVHSNVKSLTPYKVNRKETQWEKFRVVGIKHLHAVEPKIK